MPQGTDQTTAELGPIAAYYAARLAEHGTSARGVDWNGTEGQVLRLTQLLRLVEDPAEGGFSINDVGCGYGALVDCLDARFPRFSYTGLDISAEMVSAAQARHSGRPDCRFVTGATLDRPADYSVASGIFNVRLETPDAAWETHVLSVLDMMADNSTRGFAFNCLTSYSDADRMQARLYYASPSRMFDICMQRYGRNVALLHDYGLYEFTILVRKR